MYNFKDIYNYSKDLNILYIEDDINLLNENSIVFDNFFASVTTAIDGEDGLHKYIQYKKDTTKYFDLIITDINMPKKDGMELISDIKKINEKQPILVISAYSESDRLIDMISLGIDGFILKPIKIEQLMNQFYKISEMICTLKEKENFMMQQSKNAVMGEMIDAIAHQWIQPLNIISIEAMAMNYHFKNGLVNEKYIDVFRENVTNQIEHMMSTLNEFRDFFRPTKDTEDFDVKEMIEKVLLLLKDEFINNSIEIEINDTQNFILHGIENEFKHLIINIINNSKEAFNENSNENKKISINLLSDEKHESIEIIDNAGGIAEDIIDDIFKANVTTKEKGTGIGLYMSSQIAEKYNGTLSVENREDGAKFIFRKEKNLTMN